MSGSIQASSLAVLGFLSQLTGTKYIKVRLLLLVSSKVSMNFLCPFSAPLKFMSGW